MINILFEVLSLVCSIMLALIGISAWETPLQTIGFVIFCLGTVNALRSLYQILTYSRLISDYPQKIGKDVHGSRSEPPDHAGGENGSPEPS